MPRFIKRLKCLLSFLTIYPLKCGDIEEAARGFHLVPLAAIAEWLPQAPLILMPDITPRGVLAALVIALTHLITGFNHLDGFADFAEAILAGRNSESRLRIMKDKYKGTFAIGAVTIALLTCYAALNALPPHDILIASYVAILTANEAMYVLALTARKPPYKGLAWTFINAAQGMKRHVLTNSALYALTLIPLILLDRASLIIASLASLSICVLTTRIMAHRLLGFVTGDVMGFCFEYTRITTCVLLSSLPFLVNIPREIT